MGGWLTKSSKVEVQTNTSFFGSKSKNASTSPRRARSPKQIERDEEIRLKKYIYEVLKEDYDWDCLEYYEIVQLFTELLTKDKTQIEIAWKNWRHKSYEKIFIDNLVLWSPSIYEDNANLTYANFFPCVINQIDGNPFIGYNQNLQNWSGMLKLDFLPTKVNDIIAGDGGLLCVNGGLQPRANNPSTPPIPHSEDYNYTLYPQQSILLVCNPLTKEIKFIPRHTNKTLENKIAWMSSMVYPNKIDMGKFNTSKQRYRIYIIGSHQDVPSLDTKGCDELVLMAYDSRSDLWIFGSIVGECRFPEYGKTNIAIFDEGFMIGGQEKSIKNNEKCTRKLSNVSANVDESRTPCFKSEKKFEYLWINKLFFIHSASLKWHTLDFEILDSEGFPRQDLQAPRIMQCRPGDTIFVVIRSVVDSSTIEIHEVLMVDGYPSGEYLLVTTMPKDIYKSLFNSEKSLQKYDCCAGSQFLCFLALNDRKKDKVNLKKNIESDLKKFKNTNKKGNLESCMKNITKDNVKGSEKGNRKKNSMRESIKVDLKHVERNNNEENQESDMKDTTKSNMKDVEREKSNNNLESTMQSAEAHTNNDEKNNQNNNLKSGVNNAIQVAMKVDKKKVKGGGLNSGIKDIIKDDININEVTSRKKKRKKDGEKETKVGIVKNTSNVAFIATYDVILKRWGKLMTPNLNNEGSNSSYALAKCNWNPNWSAKP